MGKVIGIDLGTTNSLVAVIEGGNPIIIPNLLGNRSTPSVVRILENGNYIVGENAAKALITDPKNTISGIKRFIGRQYNEVMDIVPTVPFDVVLGRNNFAMIRCHGVDYSPQVISAMILQYLRASAEAYLGEVVTQAVITVPAYFSDRQRHATKDAGSIAGLKVLRIINEPTAASMAYELYRTNTDETIVVFDLGGGTFDITILEVGGGVLEVLSSGGDGFLGGDDFDNKIIDWILEEIKLEYGFNPTDNILALQRVAEVAKQAKCALSELNETTIYLPYIGEDNGDHINIELILTRTKFEEICEELFENLIRPCKQAIKDAKISLQRIDKFILVGGATRMQKVSEIIKRVFNAKLSSSVNPDEVVALGVAIQAGVIDGSMKEILLLDTAPHSLGIEIERGITTRIIRKHSTIPIMGIEVFSTLFDGQSSVDIHILEGDGELTIDNRSLGRFILDGIPPAAQGTPQIQVIFRIDANGTLDVTAKNKNTGKEESMSVQIRMSKDEIEVMSNILSTNAASITRMQVN
jgi:molecular chaperone DnaK